MNNVKPTYIPGMCNIGPAEIKLRRLSGIVGLVITIVLWGLFIIFDTPAVWRLFVFLPATLSAIGFLQAQLHFCVNFAMRGLFNVSDGLKHEESIDQKEYRHKDQQKAVIIMISGIVIGLVVAGLAYFLTK